MRGRSCLPIACRVARGSALRSVNSTASPDFAAQAAAGIANSRLARPRRSHVRRRAARRRRSRRRRWRRPASDRVGCRRYAARAGRPGPRGVADLDRLRAARGGRARGLQRVERGRGRAWDRSSPSVSRIGARSGGAISAAAAMPGAPVLLVDERHGPRPRPAGLAGIGRGGRPGRIGGRDPRRRPGSCSSSRAQGSPGRSGRRCPPSSRTSTGLLAPAAGADAARMATIAAIAVPIDARLCGTSAIERRTIAAGLRGPKAG